MDAGSRGPGIGFLKPTKVFTGSRTPFSTRSLQTSIYRR
jgi:hypothetical protein